MSSSSAAKFQDHYAILGVDPKSDLDAIGKAFQELKTALTAAGEAEKLDAVQIAYEVLSDSSLRASFDKIKGVNQSEREPKFSGADFFDLIGRDTLLRSAVLCILYDRRRTRPFTPTLSVRALENMLAATNEELVVALWYLKQRNLVVNDDKSSLQITVDGLDFLDRHKPTAEMVMPLIKPTSIEGEEEDPAPVAVEPAVTARPARASVPAPAAAIKTHESVLSVLNRALSRV